MMLDRRETLRDEKKFIISRPVYEILRSRLSAALDSDGHYGKSQPYLVRSLYFDDINMTAFRSKLNGIENRTKYRLRCYNLDSDYMVFEKKEKRADKSYKLGVRVSARLAEGMLSGDCDCLNCSNEPLLREFYVLSRYRGLHPSVLVDYSRIAFTFPLGDVRLTLDSGISSGAYSTDFFGREVAGFPVLDDGFSVFEVKYNGILPPHISHLFEDLPLTLSSSSKYCMSLSLLL